MSRFHASLGMRPTRRLHAPIQPIRDQGNSKLGTGDVEAAVVRGMLLAYDTDKRLQQEGLSKAFSLKQSHRATFARFRVLTMVIAVKCPRGYLILFSLTNTDRWALT